MLDRNFILALAVSVTLVVSYNLYYQWRFGDYLNEQPAKQAAQQAEKEQKAEHQAAPAGPPTDGNKATVDGSSSAVPSAPAVEGTADAPVQPVESGSSVDNTRPVSAKGVEEIKISTGVAQIILSNLGAVPVAYDLTEYHDENAENISLIFDQKKYKEKLLEEGYDEEEKAGSKSGANFYPTLGLKFPVGAFSRVVNRALFNSNVSEKKIELAEGDKPKTIKYNFVDGSGVAVEKIYTFYPGKYYFDFSIIVKSTPKWGEFDYSLVWYGLGDENSDFISYYSYLGPIVMVNGMRMAEPPEDDEPLREYEGNITWAALTNRYFTMFGIPESSGNQSVSSRYLDDSNATLEWNNKARLIEQPFNIRFYLGPKRHDLLKEHDLEIKSIINYGWFDIIAKPMFWVLNQFHSLTGNWGWAIILLTAVVKILFFPLTQRGFKSMQKLQKLQPQMKRLQEAYKDDKEKMNQEMMALYKEHKVNPVGGCMPMILQIPIFFALYKVLLESIELKGAEFILWIKDLSLQDPYYVTPLLMGASMFVQQMMTPKTGDPMQRKMMMALPVIFTVMFLTFPAGLVVYWLVNNILTIGQQWIIYREAK